MENAVGFVEKSVDYVNPVGKGGKHLPKPAPPANRDGTGFEEILISRSE